MKMPPVINSYVGSGTLMTLVDSRKFPQSRFFFSLCFKDPHHMSFAKNDIVMFLDKVSMAPELNDRGTTGT